MIYSKVIQFKHQALRENDIFLKNRDRDMEGSVPIFIGTEHSEPCNQPDPDGKRRGITLINGRLIFLNHFLDTHGFMILVFNR